MPLATLSSESPKRRMGSRLAADRSDRSPNVTAPPDLGGPTAFCRPDWPSLQEPAVISAPVMRIPSTRLRTARRTAGLRALGANPPDGMVERFDHAVDLLLGDDQRRTH